MAVRQHDGDNNGRGKLWCATSEPDALDLRDVTLVGFSMGGGEVARYFSEYAAERLHSVVFASAVPPYLMQTPGSPDGPLTASATAAMTVSLTKDQDAFYDQFTTEFFSVDGVLKVTEQQRHEALGLYHQAGRKAALACMAAFGNTDFRDGLTKVTAPALILHGDGDATVPYESSGRRTARLQRQPSR